jgi:uncharacterized protein (DUF697 family)
LEAWYSVSLVISTRCRTTILLIVAAFVPVRVPIAGAIVAISWTSTTFTN